jgi:hypothetical protein
MIAVHGVSGKVWPSTATRQRTDSTAGGIRVHTTATDCGTEVTTTTAAAKMTATTATAVRGHGTRHATCGKSQSGCHRNYYLTHSYLLLR